MTHATPGNPTFRRHRRQAVERFGLLTTIPLIAVTAGAIIVGSRPVDYLFYGSLALIAAGCSILLALPGLVLRVALRRHVPVTLTTDGIHVGPPTHFISWADVAVVATIRRLPDRHVVLTLRDGRAARLHAPRGSGWLPDARFEQELTELRRWVAQHGVPAERDDKPRHRRVVAITAGMVVLLAAAAVRAADRGVIWPSAPTVTHTATACPALDAAGLDQQWAAGSRFLTRDEHDRIDLGDYSSCEWVANTDGGQDPPFRSLSAVIRRCDRLYTSSPIAMATDAYRSDRAAQRAATLRSLPGLGDEASITVTQDAVHVRARRANVVVSIDVGSHARDEPRAEAAARQLTAAIITGLEPQ